MNEDPDRLNAICSLDNQGRYMKWISPIMADARSTGEITDKECAKVALKILNRWRYLLALARSDH